MADYKELLRRAVEALPENTGAARRAVYEKARAAGIGRELPTDWFTETVHP